MKPRLAFSMVEVLVAAVIVGMAVGPMIATLSSSNRASGASGFEIMAVHYASELGEQIQRLSLHLQPLHSATGKTAKDLLEDFSVLSVLGPQTPPQTSPVMVQLPGTDVSLFASPLHPNFTARNLIVEPLSPSSTNLLNLGTFWKVTISLAWRMAANDPVIHGASYSVILREEPP